jgi:hypothetical protein
MKWILSEATSRIEVDLPLRATLNPLISKFVSSAYCGSLPSHSGAQGLRLCDEIDESAPADVSKIKISNLTLSANLDFFDLVVPCSAFDRLQSIWRLFSFDSPRYPLSPRSMKLGKTGPRKSGNSDSSVL